MELATTKSRYTKTQSGKTALKEIMEGDAPVVLKITLKQSKCVNALIRRLCCNCDDGNCLLLDDGELHSCVQLIGRYGIYCNYSRTPYCLRIKNCMQRSSMPQKANDASSALRISCQERRTKDIAPNAPRSKGA